MKACRKTDSIGQNPCRQAIIHGCHILITVYPLLVSSDLPDVDMTYRVDGLRLYSETDSARYDTGPTLVSGSTRLHYPTEHQITQNLSPLNSSHLDQSIKPGSFKELSQARDGNDLARTNRCQSGSSNARPPRQSERTAKN